MTIKKLNGLTFVLFMASLVIASCNLIGSPEIIIEDARVVPSRGLIGVVSAYVTIINKGNGTDKLTGCMIKDMPDVRCRLHDVIDGKMVRADEITIAAGRPTYLKRGYQHLMIYGLAELSGNELPLVLSFAKSGQVNVNALNDAGE